MVTIGAILACARNKALIVKGVSHARRPTENPLDFTVDRKNEAVFRPVQIQQTRFAGKRAAKRLPAPGVLLTSSVA